MFPGLVSFQVWSICVQGLSVGGIQVLNHERLGSASRQDYYSVGLRGCPTSRGDSWQDNFKGVELVLVRSLKYQTCLMLCRSTVTSQGTTTDPN